MEGGRHHIGGLPKEKGWHLADLPSPQHRCQFIRGQPAEMMYLSSYVETVTVTG